MNAHMERHATVTEVTPYGAVIGGEALTTPYIRMAATGGELWTPRVGEKALLRYLQIPGGYTWFAFPAVVVKRDMLVESSICCYLTEASTLGLRPGEWPERLRVEHGLGNGLSLLRYRTQGTIEEVEFVLYRQELGSIEVKVFND